MSVLYLLYTDIVSNPFCWALGHTLSASDYSRRVYTAHMFIFSFFPVFMRLASLSPREFTSIFNNATMLWPLALCIYQ